MKLFKIILFFFAIYLIRRFWQMFQALKKRQEWLEEQERKGHETPTKDPRVVEAEFTKKDG